MSNKVRHWQTLSSSQCLCIGEEILLYILVGISVNSVPELKHFGELWFFFLHICVSYREKQLENGL